MHATTRHEGRRPNRRRTRWLVSGTAPLVLSLTLGACAPGPAESADRSATPTTTEDAPVDQLNGVHGTGLVPETMAPDQAAMQSVTAAPPAAYDLTRWAPPPGDQGNVGSCVAWSIAYTALGWYQRHDNIGGGALAPMYTYAQLARGNDQGSTFGGNLSIATSQGVDTQADYVPQGNYDFTTQATSAQRTNAAKWKLSGYRSLAVDQVAIESSIAANHPVVIGIPVYANFFSVGPANHGFYTGASGGLSGYHAIAALGYDATGLRIENSWGARWGDAGFATLSWDFVRNNVFTAIEISPFAAGAPSNNVPVPTAPTVSSVSPSSGPLGGGQTITVTGTGLGTATSLLVGGVAATGLAPNTAGTSLRAVVPVHAAGTAAIVITNGGGINAPTTAANYRYLAPTVTRMTPAAGGTDGGTKVTITGTNLVGATVSVGSTIVAAPVVPAGTSLSFTTPPGSGTATVTVTVTVGPASVQAGTFAYVAPPTISTLSVERGRYNATTALTITGTNFTPGTQVVIGGRVVVPKVAANGTSLTVTVPTGSRGTAALSLKTEFGASSPRTWTWY